MNTPKPPSVDESRLLALGAKADGATASFNPPTIADLSAAMPQFTFDELIGSGGMGAVYRVRRTDSAQPLALKVLPRELAARPGFYERFAREGRALSGLTHPHLVTIHEAGQDGGWCWLLMELVEGANLREVMRTGRLSPDQALRLVPQLCEALQYVHDKGVVHRDIKPDNILIDDRGFLKLTDFGLAKLIDEPATGSALTQTGAMLGTMHYMAPEQVEGASAVDHRADIYAVGVVLYEMLTGGLPLGRFQPPSQQVEVDVRVDEVVLKALAKNPELRYQRASDVGDDVEKARSVPGTHTPQHAAGAAPAGEKRYWNMDLNSFCMLMHLATFGNMIFPGGGLVLQIVMWATQKSESEIIDAHGRIIFNWLISSFIYTIIFVLLSLFLIGIPFLIALMIIGVLFPIIGAVQAHHGVAWPYPLSIHFFRITPITSSRDQSQKRSLSTPIIVLIAALVLLASLVAVGLVGLVLWARTSQPQKIYEFQLESKERKIQEDIKSMREHEKRNSIRESAPLNLTPANPDRPEADPVN